MGWMTIHHVLCFVPSTHGQVWSSYIILHLATQWARSPPHRDMQEILCICWQTACLKTHPVITCKKSSWKQLRMFLFNRQVLLNKLSNWKFEISRTDPHLHWPHLQKIQSKNLPPKHHPRRWHTSFRAFANLGRSWLPMNSREVYCPHGDIIKYGFAKSILANSTIAGTRHYTKIIHHCHFETLKYLRVLWGSPRAYLGEVYLWELLHSDCPNRTTILYIYIYHIRIQSYKTWFLQVFAHCPKRGGFSRRWWENDFPWTPQIRHPRPGAQRRRNVITVNLPRAYTSPTYSCTCSICLDNWWLTPGTWVSWPCHNLTSSTSSELTGVITLPIQRDGPGNHPVNCRTDIANPSFVDNCPVSPWGFPHLMFTPG